MKIGWVMGKDNFDDSCSLARVLRPHQQLVQWGVDSRLFGPAASVRELQQCDLLIFHRTLERLNEVAGGETVVGFDLADDLLRYQYASLPVDFILTDSLPNTRFYLSRNTHYWPHGFPDQTAAGGLDQAARTRFVFCGAPENVHCLLGDPLNALEQVGNDHPISLTIITNLEDNKEPWLAKLPTIRPANYEVEWIQFRLDTHEQLMQRCHIGLFPQAMDRERWRKKSIFKPTHAASLGLPSISSPTEEACMNFLHGQTALLPRTAADWVSAVELAVDARRRLQLRESTVQLYQLRFTIEMAAQQVLAIAAYQLERGRRQRFKAVRRMLLRSANFAERALDAVQKRLPGARPASE